MFEWILGFAIAAGAPPADAQEILRRADAPHAAFAEGEIAMTVSVAERDKPSVPSRLDLFVQGTDRSLCVFLDGKQKGRKILTVGDKVWLIVPGSARSVPVSKSQRLMGAASFGDVARIRFAVEFDGTLRAGEEMDDTARGRLPCLVLDLVAKRPGAAHPKGVLWVGKEDGLPRRLTLDLASGKTAKDIRFTGYGADGRLRTMEIRDLLTAGGTSVTTLTFERYDAKPIDEATFDPERVRALP